jgi:hypothetical protein
MYLPAVGTDADLDSDDDEQQRQTSNPPQMGNRSGASSNEPLETEIRRQAAVINTLVEANGVLLAKVDHLEMRLRENDATFAASEFIIREEFLFKFTNLIHTLAGN